MQERKGINFASGAVLVASLALAGLSGTAYADTFGKKEPIQHVKICTSYGAGFYYIPGTNTCVRIAGFVQAEVDFNGGGSLRPAFDSDLGAGTRAANYFSTRTRVRPYFDTRTETDYGVVRTYFASIIQFDSGAAAETGALGADLMFVQFAGFTFGRAVSQYDTPWTGYLANNSGFFIGGSDTIIGINQISHTSELGAGWTATLALEEGRSWRRGKVLDTNTLTASQLVNGGWGDSSGGLVAPEIVGRIRYDQPWATFQVAGAAHDVNVTYYSSPAGIVGPETVGHPDSKWGFAVQGGLQLKQLPTGKGDTFSLDASYSNGAIRYLIAALNPIGFSMYGKTDVAGAYQGIAFANVVDGVFTGGAAGNSNTGSGIELTSGWGIRAAFNHFWTPATSTSIYASYTSVDFNQNAAALICSRYAISIAGQGVSYSCNPDFRIWQIGSRSTWTPVENLTFSAEVLYTLLDNGFSGTANLTRGVVLPATLPKPTGRYEFHDEGSASVQLRVRRTY